MSWKLAQRMHSFFRDGSNVQNVLMFDQACSEKREMLNNLKKEA